MNRHVYVLGFPLRVRVSLFVVSPSASLLILLSLGTFVCLSLFSSLDQFHMLSCDVSESHVDRREDFSSEGEGGALFVCLYLDKLYEIWPVV